MRRLLVVSLTLLAAACATTPKEVPVPVQPGPAKPSGSLIGLTVRELGERFGKPQLQVSEGSGTKLQWAGGGCVIDAYLYPPARGGAPAVSYAEARRDTGDALDLATCLRMMGR